MARKTYSEEQKQDAIRIAGMKGFAAAARETKISAQTIARWAGETSKPAKPKGPKTPKAKVASNGSALGEDLVNLAMAQKDLLDNVQKRLLVQEAAEAKLAKIREIVLGETSA